MFPGNCISPVCVFVCVSVFGGAALGSHECINFALKILNCVLWLHLSLYIYIFVCVCFCVNVCVCFCVAVFHAAWILFGVRKYLFVCVCGKLRRVPRRAHHLKNIPGPLESPSPFLCVCMCVYFPNGVANGWLCAHLRVCVQYFPVRYILLYQWLF